MTSRLSPFTDRAWGRLTPGELRRIRYLEVQDTTTDDDYDDRLPIIGREPGRMTTNEEHSRPYGAWRCVAPDSHGGAHLSGAERLWARVTYSVWPVSPPTWAAVRRPTTVVGWEACLREASRLAALTGSVEVWRHDGERYRWNADRVERLLAEWKEGEE